MFDLSDILLAYDEERARCRAVERHSRREALDVTRAVTPEVVDHYRGIAHELRKTWLRRATDKALQSLLRLLRKS